jgi:hypothetical protein
MSMSTELERMDSSVAGWLSENPKYVIEVMKLAFPSDISIRIAELANQIFDTYRDLFFQIVMDVPEEDESCVSLYQYTEKMNIDSILLPVLEWQQLIEGRENEVEWGRSFAVVMCQIATISDFLISFSAFDIRRKDVRPDISGLFSKEVYDHPKYTLFENTLKASLNYSKDEGPGSSLLNIFGEVCTRDCTKCPISAPLITRYNSYLLACKYKCPLFTSRLALCYEPFFTYLTFPSRASLFTIFQAFGSIRFSTRAAVRLDMYRYKAKILATNLDFLDKETENNSNFLYIRSASSMSLDSLFMDYVALNNSLRSPMLWYESLIQVEEGRL